MLEKENIFINRFLRHTRAVQDNMIFLEKNKDKLDFLDLDDFILFKRGLRHDIDKLENDLIEYYITMAEYYNIPNTIDKDKVILAKQQIQKHYKTQRHHFYTNGLEPNLVDICEMCCDIDAIATEQKEENNTLYFENYILVEYPHLFKMKDIILKIFYFLREKENIINDDEKSVLLDRVIKYIRKLQDDRLLLERNRSVVNLPFDKWEFFRMGMKNDVKCIDKYLCGDFGDECNNEIRIYMEKIY